MSSHSETTKPHISIEELLAQAGGLEPLLEQRDRMAAALSDFVAGLRLANEMLASRDERIRALSALLEEAAMIGSWKLDALHDWQDRARALLKEADDG